MKYITITLVVTSLAIGILSIIAGIFALKLHAIIIGAALVWMSRTIFTADGSRPIKRDTQY